MRTVAAAFNLAGAMVLVAGCHGPTQPPLKAAEAVAARLLTKNAEPVPPHPAVGALFVGGTDAHSCTASVVASKTQNLILTAAHCLAGGTPATFVPAFKDTAAPQDVWTVDAVYMDPRWITSQDPKADYAFARVSRPAGGAVESVAGRAFTLGASSDIRGAVSVVGYPSGVGGPPIGCDVIAEIERGGYPSLRCGGLVDGTSGAPWIKGSAVVGVIGGFDGGGCEANVSYSPPFDAATAALLSRAEAGGPGDDAPTQFDSQC
ncbi:trypsin-like serine peptidase [Mycolicibacterium sphagni]|uniref:Trypsin n=1 Tax=Mycolicibacterium sphagni TaxID=1786 RepID=A0A255DUX0_9MYCO|nr:trypsin-like peptidase domain-containing protein [Mycolicibacterium sphagni]MCV7178850.1 trypsin-like peptidase domain-containing protein [Mycolicibacterium sphagni]OYN83024.1 trypsin [Mycolicibacterium sphagni]